MRLLFLILVMGLLNIGCSSISKRETALELEVQMLRDGLAFQESQTLELNKELDSLKEQNQDLISIKEPYCDTKNPEGNYCIKKFLDAIDEELKAELN